MQTKKTIETVSRSVRLNSIMSLIATVTGRLTRSHHELRHCSRCGKAISDPATWEIGIGSVCSQKNTVIFAKTIPVNFAMVTMTALALKAENLPSEVTEVWGELRKLIFDHSEHAANAEQNQNSGFSLVGEDVRVVAKVVDWMLSFQTAPTEKQQLIAIVKYLGFPGLAGVLSGKGSTGEAAVGFDNGRLTLVGSSNKEGFLEMKKIPGVTVPKFRGDKTPYTVPAKEHERFFNVAVEFWPCFEGDIPELREKCLAWITANPERVEVRADYSDKPVATVQKRTEDFSLNFRWIRGVSERIVNELKGQVAPKDRKYDPSTYTWFFKLTAYDKVMELIKDSYSVETKELTEPTPAGLFGYTPAPNGNSYGRTNYRRNWSRG